MDYPAEKWHVTSVIRRLLGGWRPNRVMEWERKDRWHTRVEPMTTGEARVMADHPPMTVPDDR